MKRYRETIRNGEAFALKRMPAADIMGLLCADPIPPNEPINGGVVVHVRGPLEHHSTPYCDNYDDLCARFTCALDETDGCVVLKIDSPGGLVSGLNETVYAMQEAARESGIDVIVYVDELAASAAYAISCVGGEIVVPESGIVGSVGVISAMTSVARANEKAGVDVVTITSGARKADGHPDVPIDDEAIEAEQGRVDDLAGQFFELVKAARDVDVSKFEAGLFLGTKAVKAGLADRVANWPQLLVDIAEDYGSGEEEVAQDGTVPSRATEAQMNLNALISRAEKALAAEKDPKKRAALAGDIAMFRGALAAGTKKTYKKTEEQRSEETDDKDEEEAEGGNETDREEEDDTPEKDDDKKESRKAKKAKTHRAESEEEEEASSEEEEESAESEEEEASAEDDKDEEEALAALVGALKGPRAQRALGALAALRADAKAGRQAGLQVRRLTAKLATDALHATIDAKLAKRFISRTEAHWLKSQPRATVDSFLKTHKGPIVLTEEDAATPPHAGTGIPVQGDASQLGPQQMAVLEKVAAGAGVPLETLIKQYKPTTPNGIKLGGN